MVVTVGKQTEKITAFQTQKKNFFLQNDKKVSWLPGKNNLLV